MDGVLVSARMSRAKKERGTSVLASLGATTSDLINNAFDYVIAERQLPHVAETGQRSPSEFATFVRESTLEVNWPEGFAGDYKAQMARSRLADYESLA